ncbi:MAG: methyltransferase domain-containing protein [Planctomycetes bacterium]|nr:methyltransferase domain-containing protein [Planctomycetota bacterium]MCH9727134.1 methyltransferase domain-containing protein [Planctomycetota bacterium]MCH9778527.1 methyltransferase domain-containing protein [Planctomycetota bacterium]MCH9789587.1 methyltransferase domain-containing protein [Planctomycetota bacterium]
MCNNCNLNIDAERTDEFGQKLLEIVNHSSLSLMMSIGHRSRLFDIMSEMEHASSSEIAEQSGLNERYVREWLGAMVTGEIIEYDPVLKTYFLPAEHAALLTRAAGSNNFATTMQWFSVLGSVEDQIVDCFQAGGGVPYSEFARFHEVMAEESYNSVVSGLFEHILPLVPGLEEKLNAGMDVLDIGCGSGLALIEMAATFPKSRFTGFDISEESIGRAKQTAAQRGISNVSFEVQDVSQMNAPESFDFITAFDVIHDQANPAQVLSEVNAALRMGGTFLMQDIAASSNVEQNITNPLGPMFYTISTMHCMTVSLAQGGAGLGTCWGKELACQMLGDAGFQEVDVQELPHDIMNYFYVMTKM